MKIGIDIDDSITNCNKVNELGIETILFSSKTNIRDKNTFYRVKIGKKYMKK